MSVFERHGNGMPEPPTGLKDETRDDEILKVVDDDPQEPSPMGTREPNLMWGVAWCAVGMACMLVEQGIGCALAAFGAAVLLTLGSRRSRVSLAVVLLVGSVLCGVADGIRYGLWTGVDTGVNAAVCAGLVAAVAFATCSRRRSNTLVCLATLAVALVSLLISEAEAAWTGTTVSAVVDQAMSALSGADVSLSTQQQLGVIAPLVSLVWPVAYLLVAAIWTSLAYLGARVALGRMGRRASTANLFKNFEMPLWVPGALLAGVVATVAAQNLPWWGDALRMVGANAVMYARVGLAVQGIALLSWLMQKNKVWPVLQAFAFVLALYLELSFFVMSVVGLVDVWANFRHLPHGESSDGRAPQSK